VRQTVPSIQYTDREVKFDIAIFPVCRLPPYDCHWTLVIIKVGQNKWEKKELRGNAEKELLELTTE